MLTRPAYQTRSLREVFSHLMMKGDLILGLASRLDAFSGYPKLI